ncbi:MAG: hypothetical protein JOY83_26520 [Alphaproteobacteria bacterium]|nr:hypothetical protein [Alphaproteobacteria bacterium]
MGPIFRRHCRGPASQKEPAASSWSSRTRRAIRDFPRWVVFDIPPTARGLDAGDSANRSAAGLHEARNDFGKTGYGGPCPPPGHGVHHYHFRLLAISRPTLDLRTAAPALDVLKAAQPYVIQQAEFVATYR